MREVWWPFRAIIPDMNDTNIATVRTGVNAGIIGVVVYLAQRLFDFTVNPTDPIVLVGVPLVVAFGYRLSRWLTAKVPTLSWLLFGIGDEPTY